MKLTQAIDLYVQDAQADGRLTSVNTIRAYRSDLEHLAQVAGNRDPAKIGRADIKRALARWEHPNSRRRAHSVYRAFFDWAMEEGLRKDSPARQVRAPRAREPQVYRLSRGEVVRLLEISRRHPRWEAIAHLGCLAGARRAELAGLQAHHFSRQGWVWIDAAIAKGGRERWVPVLDELAPVIARMPAEGYVLRPMRNTRLDNALHVSGPGPVSVETVYRDVRAMVAAAGLPPSVTVHSTRHAFGDFVARYAGLRSAQALMGHASVGTTADTYTSRPDLDELQVSVQGFRYGELPPQEQPQMTHQPADAR